MSDDMIGVIDELDDIQEEMLDQEPEIPTYAMPPDPDECDALLSQVHPSYPYGDPTSANHSASQPRMDADNTSRVLYMDIICMGDITATLRWKELALDHLLPMNTGKAEAENGAHARENAAGNPLIQNALGTGAHQKQEDEINDNEAGQI
ncbi:hypothetical protein K439DRAFT_1408918 [Ramaria rubella]|nr:hypothetical protein K439DRAFT_1408918 [Ramaria rubella]